MSPSVLILSEEMSFLLGCYSTLHQDARIDAVSTEQRREIGRPEGAANRRQFRCLHPGIIGACGIPEMLMGVDHRGSGSIRQWCRRID